MAYDPIIYGGSKSSVKGYASDRRKYFEDLEEERKKPQDDTVVFGGGSDGKADAVSQNKSFWEQAGDVVGGVGNFVKDAAISIKDDAVDSFTGIKDVIEGSAAADRQSELEKGANDISNKYNKEINDIYGKYIDEGKTTEDGGADESQMSADDLKKISDARSKRDKELSDYKGRTNFDEESKKNKKELDESQDVDALKTAGATASTFLNVATLGSGTGIKALGKKGVEEVSESLLKQAAKQGTRAAAEGAVFGAAGGATSAVARDEDVIQGALQGAAGGAILGGTVGAGSGALKARGVKKANATAAADDAARAADDASINGNPDEVQAIADDLTMQDNATAQANADFQARQQQAQGEFDDIMANRRAGLNDDGSRIINTDDVRTQIQDLQNGNYSDDLFDISTNDGKAVTPEDIQAASQRQVEILTARRDEIAAQVDAIESPQARELAMQNVNKLDDQIAAITSGDTKVLLQTGESGLTRTLNTDRVRERFGQLQDDLAEGSTRERQARLEAEQRAQPSRTFDSVSDDMDALGAGGVAPEAVTPRADFVDVDEVVRHPNLPEPLKRRAMSLARDRNMIEQQRATIMTRQKADATLDILDQQFNDNAARIETMPEPRRTAELNRIQNEYNAAYEQIEGQVANDARIAGELDRVEEQIYANTAEVMADANIIKDAAPTEFGQVDEALNQKISQEIEVETENAIFNRMSKEDGSPEDVNVSKVWTQTTDEGLDANLETPQVGSLTRESLNDTFTNDGVKIYGDNVKALDSTYAGLSMSSTSHNLTKVFGETGTKLFGNIVKGYAHVSKANEKIAKDLTQIKKAFGGNKELYTKVVDVLEGKDVDVSTFTPAQVDAVAKLRELYDYGGRQVRKMAYNDVVHSFEKRVADGKAKYTVDEIKQLAKRDGVTIREATANYGSVKDFKKSDIDFLANNRAENSTLDNYFPHMFDKDGRELDFFDNDYVKSNGTVKFGNMLHRLSDEDTYSRDIIDVSARYFAALNKKAYLEPALRELDNAKLAIKAADSDANAVWQWIDKYQGQLKYNKADSIGKAWNEMVDKTISLKNPNSAKIGQNHYRSLLSTQRQVNALAALGLSFRNAIQQTTQIGTTIGNLGVKDTAVGMVKYLKQSLNPTTHRAYLDMLDEHGITHAGIAREAYSELLTDGIGGTARSKGSKLSDGLMIMTSKMDEFARGATYEASLMANLRKNMPRAEAEALATADAARMNFMTSKVDMPVALNGDTVRSLSQFLTFSYKQAEAWKDLGLKSFKNEATGQYQFKPKELSRLVQMMAFYGVAFQGMSQVAGIEPEDNIPFYGNIFGDSGLPKSPIVSILFGRNETTPGLFELVGGITNPEGKNDFEREENRKEMFDKFTDMVVKNFVPAGSQASKTVTGLESTSGDGVVSKDGRVRFIQNTDDASKLKAGLFGQYSTEAGKEWIDKRFPTLSEKQSEIVNQQNSASAKQRAYDFYSGLKGVGTKSTMTPNIKDTLKTQPNKAQRLTEEHNAEVSKAVQAYTSKYGELSDYEKDYLMKNYYITIGNVKNLSEEDK